MKKLTAVLLAFSLLTGIFCACGAKQPVPEPESEAVSVPEPLPEPEPEPEPDPEPTAEEIFRKDNRAAEEFSFSETQSVAVMALLGCLLHYEDCLQASKDLGMKWVYTNQSKYANQNSNFATMFLSGKLGGNCASPANWSLKDLGILPHNLKFYGGTDGSFVHWSKVRSYLETACVRTDFTDIVPSFATLYKNACVQPGDIFICKGHVFIYMGDEKFFAAGHDAHWHKDTSAKTEDSRSAVMDSFVYEMKDCSNYKSAKITYRLRLKPDYIPQFYYNANGRLVENPMYAEQDPAAG